MKSYLSLCLKGKITIPERKIMLDKQKAELKECVDFIDNKQHFYDIILKGKVKYNINLINVED